VFTVNPERDSCSRLSMTSSLSGTVSSQMQTKSVWFVS
jgi:hypothetical protein